MALRSGKRAYYTTPLVALTDQKFADLQERAAAWGFSPDDIGLATGNRRINPDAKIMVVVAEILLNRLLDREHFQFDDVDNVVMDEFHSFADVERGIVWEMTLALLPRHVKTLLLSATVGNAHEFRMWLSRCHEREVHLVEGSERRVPLTFQWIGDQTLDELLVSMAKGEEEARFTPSLVFCFNRDECWTIAEMLKGKKLIDEGRQSLLAYELKKTRLERRRRPETQTDPAARHWCAPCRCVGKIPPHRGKVVSGKAIGGNGLYRDVGGGYQSSGAQRRLAHHPEGPVTTTRS